MFYSILVKTVDYVTHLDDKTMKSILGLVFISLHLMACGPGWDKWDNDYALRVEITENYFTLEKFDNYKPSKHYKIYLNMAQKHKDKTFEILEKKRNERTKYTGSLLKQLVKHIQNDKKILIILDGQSSLVKERKQEIVQLVRDKNIQITSGVVSGIRKIN